MFAPFSLWLFRFLPVLVLLLGGCGFGANPFTAQEVVEKSFRTDEPTRVVVETFNGRIDVVTTTEKSVVAKVTKRAGGTSQEAAEEALQSIAVAMTKEADTIRISARITGQGVFSSRGAAVELEVPAGSVLELRTNNGPISTTGMTGKVTAQSSNGAILVEGSRGELDLRTSNGKITVDGGQDRLTLQTSNGKIEIKSPRALVSAHTSNGAIHFAGRLAEGEHSLRTSNGKIVLTLPDDAHFRVDAQTSNGKIISSFALNLPEITTKSHVRGVVGDDPATTVKMHTSNGNIEIQKKE